MLLQTLIFDASNAGFPKPHIPLLPVGLSGVSFKRATTWAPVAHFRHFTRGRYALREAYRLAGIGPGSTLLAPAYHCRTMLDPALALGGTVVLYPLQPNLSPDLASFDDIADTIKPPIKALLATHFFGIAQDFGQLAAWCDQRGIELIEDSSHAFFSACYRPVGIGDFGSFVISSPYKFLPSPDGGILYAHDAIRLDSLRNRQPTGLAELRGIIHACNRICEHRRRHCDANRLDAEISSIVAKPTPPIRDMLVACGCSPDYRSDEEGLSSLRISQMIYRHPDITSVVQRRSNHYRRLAAATMDMPYCRPLFPDLPTGSIPYMFPLYIENPEPNFLWFKQLGLPIFRWDSMVASDCSIANDYRLHLLHLPCHQSLSTADLDWMIAVIQKVSSGKTASKHR